MHLLLPHWFSFLYTEFLEGGACILVGVHPQHAQHWILDRCFFVEWKEGGKDDVFEAGTTG